MYQFLTLVVLFLSSFQAVLAYVPVMAEPKEAYMPIMIEGDPYIETLYLGDLNDAPDLFELKTEVSISLRLQVLQKDNRKAVPFGLIMVRQNDDDGGVEEIVRQTEPLDVWDRWWSHRVGMSFMSAPEIVAEIKPGTYRIEVSTPDNKGPYALLVGEESVRQGFVRSVISSYKIHDHFSYIPLGVFMSVYVYSVLLFFSVLAAFYWYKRKIKS